MSHRQTRQQLGDFLEGELAPEARQKVERHLSDCATCSDELEGLRGVRALLRGIPAVEPPPYLADRVVARLREQAEQRGPLARLTQWWSETAAVAWPAPIAAAAMAMVAVAVLRGGDVPLGADPTPSPALARTSTATAMPRGETALMLASERPGSRAAAARPQAGLPPLDACIETGRSPADCIRWHSWMVGLAVREPHVFLGEVQRLPLEHHEVWLQQLGDFALRPGNAPLVTRRMPSTEAGQR